MSVSRVRDKRIRELEQTEFFELFVDNGNSAVESFIELCVGSKANPDEFPAAVEQPSTTASLNGCASRFDVGRTEVSVQLGHLRIAS